MTRRPDPRRRLGRRDPCPEGPQRARSLALPAAFATLALAGALAAPLRADGPTAAPADPERARVLHLLRRATFGPRPADLEEALRMGREAWVERQLHPERIPDRDVEARLTGYETLGLTPTGYWTMLERGRPEPVVPGAGEDRTEIARRRQAEANRLRDLAVREVPASVLLRAVYGRRQLQEVMVDFWRNHFNVDVSKDHVRYYLPDWEREVLRKHVFGRFEDFLLATARHPAMLFYLDNHVSRAPAARGERVMQGRERAERTEGLNENYARELMELHTVGVDNGYDQDDVIQLALVLTGWSIENGPQGRGAFVFREPWHAKGRKRVMGKTVSDGGLAEGEELIRHLAGHRNTREFVCRKMVRHLVADQPPEEIVAAAVGTWKRTKGDLREVTRTILLHPAFDAPVHRGAKAKTPLEFVASSLRVTGVEVERPDGLLARLAAMDQPIYQCEDPTGYSDLAADWMDPGVLAVRWQFAYDLLHGRVPGVRVDPAAALLAHARQGHETWEALLADELLGGERPGAATTRSLRRPVDALRRETRSAPPEARTRSLRLVATLLLGSPEFQRQ